MDWWDDIVPSTSEDDPVAPPFEESESAAPIEDSMGVSADAPAAVLPAPAVGELTLGAPGESRAAEGVPVEVAARSRDGASQDVRVEVLDQVVAARLGVSGFLFRVTGGGGAGIAVDGGLAAAVSVDYSAFAGLGGAGYADRLRIVTLPECALVDPLPAGCDLVGTPLPTHNDQAAQRLVAEVVDLAAVQGAVVAPAATSEEPAAEPAAPESGSDAEGPGADAEITPSETSTTTTTGPASEAATPDTDPAAAPDAAAAAVGPAPGEGSVFAVMAGPEGEDGSFKATPFAISGDWQVGVGSGGFSWNYDMVVPPAPAGAAPEVNLVYSSAAVDGFVTSRNTQASPTGLGWGDFADSFIERRYNGCGDDGQDFGDLCWAEDNASISLNGVAGELVEVPGSNGANWVLKADQRWRIDRLHHPVQPGVPGQEACDFNCDDDGEYWKVTTPDGTQYWFGLGRNPGAWATDSTWIAPVFGDDADEPCNESPTAHEQNWCMQAWRWNLDRVVDPNGNTQVFKYEAEDSRYARFNGVGQPHVAERYHRSGYLERIEYGRRDGNAQFAAAQVLFTNSYRCTAPDSAGVCPAPPIGGTPNPSYPDIPMDLRCSPGATCTQGSPTFFSSKRYVSVATQVKQGENWLTIDSYRLTHTFTDPDGNPSTFDDAKLFLTGIQRTGQSAAVGGSPVALPATTFEPVTLNNRFNVPADQAMPHWRIGRVTDEFGRQVNVTYGQPHPCQVPADPPQFDLNTRDCFPQMWAPDVEPAPDPTFVLFNKWLVTQVQVVDTTGGSPAMVTSYKYGDQVAAGLPNGAWHHDDDDFVPQARQSWSEWRGYQDVLVTQGTSRTRYRVFTGMNGDLVQNPSPGYRTVTLSSLDGTVTNVADQNWLAGRTLDEQSLRSDGTVEQGTLHGYTPPVVTADAPNGCNGCAGDLIQDAVWIAENDTTERRRTPSAGTVFQRRRVQTLYNGFLRLPEQVIEHGWTNQSSDERCTKTTYAINITGTNYLVDYPSSVTRYANTTCTGTEVTRSETAYDGGAVGAAPTGGNPTMQRTKITATPLTWATTTTTYDVLGRPLAVTDPNNHQTTTSYNPVITDPIADARHPLSITITNAAGHAQTTWFVDPATAGTCPNSDCARNTLGRQIPFASIDANNRRTTYTYDALGRLTAVWQPTESVSSNPSWQFIYDIHPTKTEVPVIRTRQLQDTNGAGGAARYLDSWAVLDSLLRERQTHTISPASTPSVPKTIVTETTYDDRGLVQRASLPQAVNGAHGNAVLPAPGGGGTWANSSVLGYDTIGRQTVEFVFADTDNDGAGDDVDRTTTAAYTQNSVEVTPPAGSTRTRTITDAYDRTINVDEYDGTAWRPTVYTYDRADRLLTVRDPADNVISYTYDMAGRRRTMDDPDAGDWVYNYDAAGNQTSVTDAALVQVHTLYDVINRPTERHRDSPSGPVLARWFYDQGGATGGQLGLVDKTERYHTTGTWTVDVTGYDTRNRPTGRTLTIPTGIPGLPGGPTNPYNVTYGYDAADHQTTVGYPAVGGLAAETVTTVYNSVGLPETMTGLSPYVSTAGYDDRARPQLFGFGNGAAGKLWGYDYNQRLSLQQAAAMGGTSVQNRAIGYDKAGNVTDRNATLSGASARECFKYDQRSRLTQAYTTTPATTCASGSNKGTGANPYNHTYTYSHDGNLTSRVEGTTTINYGYRPSGAGSTRPHAPETVGSDTYTWNSNGNLATRTIAGQLETFTWDAEHLLTTIDDPDGDSTFIYDADGARLLRETPQGRTLYIDGHEIIAPTAGATAAVRSYGFASQAVASRNTAGVDYLVSDNQGSVEASIPAGAAGADVGRTYLPYGKRRTGGQLDTDRAWIGQVEDDNTGLQYLNARYYDPAIGMFIAPDPIYDTGRPKTLNPYEYGLNSPASNGDPTGLAPCPAAETGAEAAFLFRTRNPGFKGDPGCPPSAREKFEENFFGGLTASGTAPTAKDGSDLAIEDVLCEIVGCSGSTLDSLDSAATALDTGLFGDAAMLLVEDWADCVFNAGNGDPWNSNCGLAAIDLIPVGKVDEAYGLYAAIRRGGGSSDEAAQVLSRSLDCSFAGDTQVLMADGTVREISDVQIGDWVLAEDPITGERGARQVTHVSLHEDQIIDLRVDGETVATTEDHPFWNQTDAEWQLADSLDQGDMLLSADGDLLEVDGLDFGSARHASAYNLTVDDIHTFFIRVRDDHVLVHNTCPADGLWMSINDALDAGEAFLGSPYTQRAPGVYRSQPTADGSYRVFRMTDSDLSTGHAPAPHVNFEVHVPDGRGGFRVTENSHVYLSVFWVVA